MIFILWVELKQLGDACGKCILLTSKVILLTSKVVLLTSKATRKVSKTPLLTSKTAGFLSRTPPNWKVSGAGFLLTSDIGHLPAAP